MAAAFRAEKAYAPEEEPMYVKSSLAMPRAPKITSRRVERPFFFDELYWQQEPMQMYEEVGSTYGVPAVMHMSKLATTPNQVAMYSEGSYAQTEKQETGSDASTADTSPYIADEMFYGADFSDMGWHGVYPPPLAADMPLPTFEHSTARRLKPQQQQPSWQHTGWGDLQNIPDVSQPELPTMGSAKHRLGQCKPCAFAWKPEGCESGAECKFCHLCPPGEKQRRKKVLRQLQRNVGLCA